VKQESEAAIMESVLDGFDEIVRTSPDAVCLRYFGRDFSWRETSCLADHIGHRMVERGVAPSDRVILALQNTPSFVASLLGAWRIGAIVVPVNPMVRVRELAYQLADSEARLVISTTELGSITVEAVQSVDPTIDVLWSRPEDLSGSDFLPHLTRRSSEILPGEPLTSSDLSTADIPLSVQVKPCADDLALLCYTSGTTGPPKGAMLTHGNLAYQASAAASHLRLSLGDSALAIAPFFHITGLGHLLSMSMANGISLLLPYRFEPEVVLDLIDRYQPDYTVAAITAFQALAAASRPGDQRLAKVSKAVSGGAPVPSQVVAEIEERFGLYIHNGYGMTESCSTTVTVPFGDRAPTDSSGALSIGKAYIDTELAVVDGRGRPVAAGEPGELVVWGPQIGVGYWKKPDETAHAFRDDGLHTGDAARIDEHGWVYLVGRLKEMVISSGFKIWPREVEDVLAAHPWVNEAAVIGVPDAYRGEALWAYVVLDAPQGTDAEVTDALVAHCRRNLSAYKCPARFHVVDNLPKTETGKVLRRALRTGGDRVQTYPAR
jgi:long-chain acyl-CoA synthetase